MMTLREMKDRKLKRKTPEEIFTMGKNRAMILEVDASGVWVYPEGLPAQKAQISLSGSWQAAVQRGHPLPNGKVIGMTPRDVAKTVPAPEATTHSQRPDEAPIRRILPL